MVSRRETGERAVADDPCGGHLSLQRNMVFSTPVRRVEGQLAYDRVRLLSPLAVSPAHLGDGELGTWEELVLLYER